MRIAVCQNKGGSGKSAMVVNLAAALAEGGDEVDVADVDPQGNSSRRLGARPDADQMTISEAIKCDALGAARDAYVPCGWGGIYGSRIRVLPARFELENRISEAGTVGAVKRLRRALAGCDDRRITLLDCPPSLGHLTQLAMVAADVVLIVAEPEFDGIEGAVRVLNFVRDHADDLSNPRLRVAGVVPSRVRTGLGVHDFQIDGLDSCFPGLVWAPHIRERAVVKAAADSVAPLRSLRSQPAREVADDFAKLATRVKDLQEAAA
ncbi:ParA family protein [Kitasatospora sp. NPDC048540]|uniref:ParA family protein n=1 Tax=unclassified Kitasatospora TaxID=2633591 RepID=UPI00053B021B|nr:ParA family protein [Kitasatospora sp. MBT63]